jgi:hypothetical protein
MQVHLEINGMLKYIYDYRYINRRYVLIRQHFIQVKLGLAAELVGYHGSEVPFRRKNRVVTVLKVLQGAKEPGKTTLGLVESRIRLT